MRVCARAWGGEGCEWWGYPRRHSPGDGKINTFFIAKKI